MPKKKIGTTKVTRKIKVTTRQRLRVESHVEPKHIETSIPLPAENTANPIQTAVRKLETSINNAPRPATLPSGKYSPTVEALYKELEKRRKSEEVENTELYDVFISHASEDKKDFVDPLVIALQDAGIRVWYDTLELQWGKSLREQIDNGIKRSKFAILVLSKNFFSKQWTKRELDGVLAKQDITGATPLPIWYNITLEDVYEFSPTLSGIFSLTTDRNSIADICKALKLQLGKEEIQEV